MAFSKACHDTCYHDRKQSSHVIKLMSVSYFWICACESFSLNYNVSLLDQAKKVANTLTKASDSQEIISMFIGEFEK